MLSLCAISNKFEVDTKLPLCQRVFRLKPRMGEFPYGINLEKFTVNIDKIKKVQGRASRNIHIEVQTCKTNLY